MPRIFSSFIIFITFLALTSLPVSALQKGQGNGQGQGKAQEQGNGQGNGQGRPNVSCQDDVEPMLTLILNGTELWTHTPEDVMKLPGNYEITRASGDIQKALKLTNLLPDNWDNGKVSFYNCRGQMINIPAPHIEKNRGRYIININKKGFLKLTLKKENSENVLMRDMRRIEIK